MKFKINVIRNVYHQLAFMCISQNEKSKRNIYTNAYQKHTKTWLIKRGELNRNKVLQRLKCEEYTNNRQKDVKKRWGIGEKIYKY